MADAERGLETSTSPTRGYESLPNFVREGITGLKFVFGLLILGTNLLTLYGLVRARGLKRTLRLGLINLTLTDAAAGAVFSYHSLAVRFFKERTLECDLRYGLLSLVISATFFTLIMMSLDRVFALYLPYRYESIMTARNLGIWITLNWLSSVGIVISSVLKISNSTTCSFVEDSQPSRLLSYAVPSLATTGVILILQVLIFTAAFQQVRKIVPTIPGAAGGGGLLRGLRLHMKATVTTGLVVVPFMLLTVPLYCVFSYYATHPEERFLNTCLFLVDACLFLQALNSLVNPAIYIWRLSQVRRQLKAALCGGSTASVESITSEGNR